MNINYDSEKDILTVEGIRYTGEVFRHYGLGELGAVFALEKREDGTITIRKFLNAESIDGRLTIK